MNTKTITHHMYRTQSAFTLLEIMIVVVIIGIIAGLAIVNLTGAKGDADIRLAGTGVKSLKTGIGLYQMQTGSYPASMDDMLKPALQGRAPILEQRPLDPWNEPFQYRYPGSHNPTGYDVWSKGPDKQDGTADDIGNWSDTAGTP